MSWRPEDLAGTTIGGAYRVVRLLGAGGMGAVFEAVQVDLGRRVALKVLHPLLADDEVQLRRLRREAVAAASLGHRNVVQVTDLQTQPGRFAFLVMELLEGRTLKQALAEDGPFAIERALTVASQMCDAMEAVHAAGIVHRDLKPANVMLIPMGELGELVKVLDFGVARLREGPGYTRLTRAGATLGSPAFMSPEQARGEALDGRSDVHALGAVVFTLLSGRPPFDGKDVTEVLVRVVSEPPPDLAAARSGVPPSLAALVSRCLAKDREERPASAAELATALRACRGEVRASPEPGPALPTVSLGPGREPPEAPTAFALPRGPEREPPEVPKALALPVASPRPAAPGRSLLALGLVVGLSLAACVAGLAVWLLWPGAEASGRASDRAADLGAAPGGGGAAFLGSVEEGFLHCREPHRFDVRDRELRGFGGSGFTVNGPCELHCLRCAFVSRAVGISAYGGARVFLDNCRVQGVSGVTASTGAAVRAVDCEVRGGHAVVSSSGATVTLVAGSVSGEQSAIMAVEGGRVEIFGTALSGSIIEQGGVVIGR